MLILIAFILAVVEERPRRLLDVTWEPETAEHVSSCAESHQESKLLSCQRYVSYVQVLSTLTEPYRYGPCIPPPSHAVANKSPYSTRPASNSACINTRHILDLIQGERRGSETRKVAPNIKKYDGNDHAGFPMSRGSDSGGWRALLAGSSDS